MIFGINTTSDIQNCFFHSPNGSWNLGQFWNTTSGIYAKYHVQFILLIVYTTTWEIQSSNAMCLFLSSCFASSASKLVLKFLFSAQLGSRHWARSMYFSQYFGFPNFLLVLESQNLEIFPPFLRNSCDEMIWWFGVTIVTVIFICRYFKLSWNTSALSQSNCRNFSGSSITSGTSLHERCISYMETEHS